MVFKKITLANGLRIILAPQPQSLAATVLILVAAGSEYETNKINGISHFLEHMMFKGTINRPKPGMIAEELAALGAQTNAFTSQEYTGYWGKAENHKLPKILDIVSDLYLNPLFNQEEIEKERGVIIEEINRYEDTPPRRVQEFFTSLLYGDQPAGWDIAGKKETIRKITKNDFLRYRGIHYIAPKTVVAIAGKFNEKEVEEQIRKRFGDLRRYAVVRKRRTSDKQSRAATFVKFKNSDQSHLVLGVRAFDLFDKRRYAIEVLAHVLGNYSSMSSRLFKRVREEMGAAYYIDAGADLYLDHGYLAVSAGVDHKKVKLVIDVILEEMRRLKKELVGESELQRSKDHIVGNMILGLETSDELAGFCGQQEILTRRVLPVERLIAKIQGVRAGEVRAVANHIFRADKLNLAIIGPYKKSQMFKKILKL